ncbi:MAG TPA: sugar ABC transporter substrate-binding protein [Steroidobacteraceae bacterium]|jgi:inositol transport system substrate-binding protein|nr:sugar ABC transporter substrate-binding protein [Steroidobacteraceae bacterium]
MSVRRAPGPGGTRRRFLAHWARRLASGAAALLLAASASAAKLGVSMASFDDRWLTGLRVAMQARATEGGIAIQFQDAQEDIGKQLSQIQNFVSQGVTAMIVNPVDTAATPRITREALAAGIPLVYVNRKPNEATLPRNVVFVGSDDHEAGWLQGEAIAKLLGGKGSVAIMLGELSNSGTAMRTAGVEEAVKRNPGMKIVQKQAANWQRIEGMNLMSNWIVAGTRIDAIASNNDEMAIGAIMALKQAGRDPAKMVIAGVDGSADALAEMAKGDLAVTVFQDAGAQGRAAVDSALALARGQRVDSYVWIPFQLVTRDNYRSFRSR